MNTCLLPFQEQIILSTHKKVERQSNRPKRTIFMRMLVEAKSISMAKIIEPRMSLAFKKELVKIIFPLP